MAKHFFKAFKDAEVIVVQFDAPSADLRQHVYDTHRRDRVARRLAEGIAPDIADRPQAEGELMFR